MIHCISMAVDERGFTEPELQQKIIHQMETD
jgi:hypothetical protein